MASVPEIECICPRLAGICRAHQVAIVPESQETIALSGKPLAQFVADHLRLHRHVGAAVPHFHQLFPLPLALLGRFEEAAIRLLVAAAAVSALQRALAIADQARPRPDSAGRSGPGRCRSARRAHCRAWAKTRCKGMKCRSSTACRSLRSPLATAACPSSPIPPVV